MPEDEQLRVRHQIQERVRSLLLRLADIQRELDERCDDRKKWPELQHGHCPDATSALLDRGTARDMYLRQGTTYTKFHHVHLEAQRCFEIAGALSREFAILLQEFMQNTWRTGQESFPPELVSVQCMKARSYLARLLEMLDENTQSRGSTGPNRKGRPPNKGPNPLRDSVRKIYEAAKQEGITLTQKDLCGRLDVQKVRLPPKADWAKCRNWTEAYSRFPRSVQRWLSEALANSK